MKIFNFLLPAIVFAIVIISCGKSNNTEGNPAMSPLYGSWKRIELIVTGCADPSINHITDCGNLGSLCYGTVEFTRTTMTSSGTVQAGSTTYTIHGNTFNYPTDGGVPTMFAIADTTLTLMYQQSVSNGSCLIQSIYVKN